jgi:hypothetical protein
VDLKNEANGHLSDLYQKGRFDEEFGSYAIIS